MSKGDAAGDVLGAVPARSYVLWRRLLSLVFLVQVLSRYPWVQAYGRGTSVNRVRMSPIPVAVYGAQTLPAVKRDHRLKYVLGDLSRVLAFPGEILGDAWRSKKKKKKKDSENGKERSYWLRANRYGNLLHKNKGLRRVVDKKAESFINR